MRSAAVPAMLLAAACGPPATAREGRLTAQISYTARDTTRFEATARMQRCDGDRGFLLDGSVKGSGVLVWLRTSDSLPAGQYPMLSRWDTLTARGAVVAVRFLTGEMAHGLALDSGSVVVTAVEQRVSGEVAGSGLEGATAQHVHVAAHFTVPSTSGAGAVECRVRL